ncbi:MAG TPA: TIGR03862 family flavoprotein, partial [Bacteroidia bacterium]|nr:TIGR03862 family flavoprotein [Bacteroidia bacterium]
MEPDKKTKIAIIGSGPAGLMLVARLNENKFEVHIYEKNKAPGRKFLVAGDGGLNLTHSEPIEQFIKRYTPSSFFEPLLRSFSNTDLQAWFNSIGVPTFTGTSKRVFPQKGIKPIEVLNAILKVIKDKNVKLHTDHNWQGEDLETDITVFALGGSSWKITGSDGSWTNYFKNKGIEIVPFQPSNCAFQINWPKNLISLAAGLPLKNISLKSLNIRKEGEVVITEFGMEGSGIYALSPQIRQQLNEQQKAICYIDLKPSLSLDKVTEMLESKPANSTMTNHLNEVLNLSKAQLALLKNITTKEEFSNPNILAGKIKELPLEIIGMAPIDEAIS